MRDQIKNAALALLGGFALVAILGVVLSMLAVSTAPFWGVLLWWWG